MNTLQLKIFTGILLVFLFFALNTNAQVNGINYQAVAVDENGKEIAGMDIQGNIIPNKTISVRFSILSGSATGAVLYQETHTTNTDSHGMFNLVIGQGSINNTGLFNNILDIDWSTTDQWLKVEIDFKGADTYKLMGVQKLLSVPYAYYALNVKNVLGDNDKDSTNELQTISKSGNTVTLNKNGGSFTDSDSQQLSIAGNNLSITNGNTIQLPNDLDNDKDSLNEIQTISKTGNIITLNKNGGTVTDSDNQNLSVTSAGTQRTFNITNGTGITIDVADKDNDSTNELQTLSYANDTLKISKGNSIVFPASSSFDYKFPDGFNNITPITMDTSVYYIPSNKNLYITNIYGDMTVSINNKVILHTGGNASNYVRNDDIIIYPIIAGGNDTVNFSTPSTYSLINGFLINKTIIPLTITNLNSNPFTVPAGKILIILNVYSGISDDLKINNKLILSGSYNSAQPATQGNYILKIPLFLKQNDIISSSTNNLVINGYLK
ncbi:MAG: hypothetical protein ACOYOV_11225 [Bacteroidales bacterium]